MSDQGREEWPCRKYGWKCGGLHEKIHSFLTGTKHPPMTDAEMAEVFNPPHPNARCTLSFDLEYTPNLIPYVLMHRGHPAFYLDHRPEYGALLNSQGIFTLDSKPMGKYAPVLCGTCNEEFRPQSADIKRRTDNLDSLLYSLPDVREALCRECGFLWMAVDNLDSRMNWTVCPQCFSPHTTCIEWRKERKMTTNKRKFITEANHLAGGNVEVVKVKSEETLTGQKIILTSQPAASAVKENLYLMAYILNGEFTVAMNGLEERGLTLRVTGKKDERRECQKKDERICELESSGQQRLDSIHRLERERDELQGKVWNHGLSHEHSSQKIAELEKKLSVIREERDSGGGIINSIRRENQALRESKYAAELENEKLRNDVLTAVKIPPESFLERGERW